MVASQMFKCRETCVAQIIDLPLLPSGPGGVRRDTAAQFPAGCLIITASRLRHLNSQITTDRLVFALSFGMGQRPGRFRKQPACRLRFGDQGPE